MSANISPKYQMNLIQKINDRLFELYKGYDDVTSYLDKWHEVYDCFGNDENFCFLYKDDERKKLDVKKTLNNIDGDTLLKIAIDLGLATPDFIPCIPTFKNELKSTFSTASQTFEKAYQNIEKDPSLSIGLANSALESIIKEILNDKRVVISYNSRETLKKLTETICKAFRTDVDQSCPPEIKPIVGSLINSSQAIEDIRSDKTILHGKTDDSPIVTDSIYSKLVINAVTTVGLFLLEFYKTKYPVKSQEPETNIDDLPF